MLSILIRHHNREFGSAFAIAVVLLFFFCHFNDFIHASDPQIAPPGEGLSFQIDQIVEQAKTRNGIVSAPHSTDAEFMRRVSLDIGGKIPPVAELRLFLNDRDSAKREKLINRLLDSPGFVVHFSNIWRAILLPEASTDLQARSQMPEFDAWLREQFVKNTPFDDMVRQIINTPLNANRLEEPSNALQGLTPRAYYLAKQLKPANLAASTSRVFLGIRIECAQCHDHPFDTWKQHQFWQYAAFFSNLDQLQQNAGINSQNVREVTGKPQIKIPDTDQLVEALFLDGIKPDWNKVNVNPRRRLSQWMTSPQNPYFAKATVNRVWSFLFGRGIIDPVDDFSSTNRATHPELIDLLAARFREHNYDFKYLIREITNSRTYQLSSRQTDPGQSQSEWYGKMPIRGLTAEQIYANLVQATGFFQQTTEMNVFPFGTDLNSPQTEITALFNTGLENQTETRATILQALALMNGTFITNATSLEQSDVFTSIVDFPGLSVEQKIEAFFLTTLSRFPTDLELKRLSARISSVESVDMQTAPIPIFFGRY